MRSYIGFGQSAYIGQPQSSAIKLMGIAAQVVPLFFPWLAYGASTLVPNINVLVDLNTSACKALDQIKGLYVDNLGSDNPIYVYFPDTGYAIVAKPNSAGWYPVFTNGKRIWIIGEGFLTGSIPQTSVLVSNVYVPPSVNVEIDTAVALYKASATISRGNTIYNKNFGTPALGDQVVNTGIPVTVPGLTNIVFSAGAPGFIYITNVHVAAVAIGTAGSAFGGSVVFESTGISGILYSWPFLVTNVPAISGNVSIYNADNCQLKLDATQTWRLRNTGSADAGSLSVILNYTINPT